jgi:glutathione S-transferase
MLEKMWRAKEAKNVELENATREELQAAAIVLESGLSGKNYLVGNEFSAADIMVGSLLNWGDTLLKMSPVFKTYFERLKARPACKSSRIFI